MTLTDRFMELRNEAASRGLADRVHNFDLVQAIKAYAVLLGYDPLEALDPESPLTR